MQNETYQQGFRQGSRYVVKVVAIQILIAAAISAAGAVGMGLEPVWAWVTIGTILSTWVYVLLLMFA
jgi:uncharacterized membrane protein YgcG